MASRWYTVVIDAKDPARLARWWAQVLDYQVVYETTNEVGIAPDENTYPGIAFIAAPQAKNGKNHIHIDLNPDDRDAEVERLVNMGARRVHTGHHDSASWIVLCDPEGNEFCVLRPRNQ